MSEAPITYQKDGACHLRLPNIALWTNCIRKVIEVAVPDGAVFGVFGKPASLWPWPLSFPIPLIHTSGAFFRAARMLTFLIAAPALPIEPSGSLNLERKFRSPSSHWSTDSNICLHACSRESYQDRPRPARCYTPAYLASFPSISFSFLTYAFRVTSVHLTSTNARIQRY